MKVLHIDSSILGGNSVSRQLSAELVNRIKESNKSVEVTYHDVVANPIPHLDANLYAAQAVAPEERSAEQQANVEIGDKALNEFLAADVVVIGAPMYNFSVSSQLKAWIDRLAVAGKTFRYTANGPEGLVGGKKIIIVSTRGGFYGAGTPLAAIDHQEPYLKAVFGFFGIEDVSYLRADGLATGPEPRQQAIELAQSQIKLVSVAV